MTQTLVTRSRVLAAIAVVGNLPALVFLAYAIAYMFGYSATFAIVAVVFLALATIGLTAAITIFAFQQIGGPLIAFDTVFVAVCVVSLPLLLILDPARPVGPAVLMIPIALGWCQRSPLPPPSTTAGFGGPIVCDPSTPGKTSRSVSRRKVPAAAALGIAVLMACDPVPVTPSASIAGQSPWVSLPMPSVATSPTGTAQAIDVTWRLGTFPDGQNARIEAIAAGGPGFVAVGAALGDGQSRPISAAVWTSPDGASWSRVTDSGLEGGFIHSVAVLPDGGFMASTVTGASCPTPPDPSADTWQSRDGLHWTRSAFQSDLGCPVMFAANPSISVGVGYAREAPYSRDISGAMWWSEDNGASWQPATGPDLKGPFFVARVPFGFVAIDANPGKVAYSRDGMTWLLPSTPPDFPSDTRAVHTSFRQAVAAGSSALVLTGIFTSKSTATLAWSSADGEIWRRVAPPLAAGRVLNASTTGAAGTVAVGWIHTATGNRPTAWTTPDGLSWLPTGDMPDNSADVPDYVAMSSTRVVALSSGPGPQGVTAWSGAIVARTP